MFIYAFSLWAVVSLVPHRSSVLSIFIMLPTINMSDGSFNTSPDRLVILEITYDEKTETLQTNAASWMYLLYKEDFLLFWQLQIAQLVILLI